MGIEPTDHDSRSSPAGFEDQARHQTGSTSRHGSIPLHFSFSLGLISPSSLYSQAFGNENYSQPKSRA